METSVIISTYDRTEDLVETLHSLDRGFERPDEVVVVDDGDVAATRDRLRAEGLTHVRLVEGDGDGLPASRNKGVDAATGDVYCFVDDDVLVPQNWLQQVRRTYEDHDVDGACGFVLNYNPEGINKANVDSLGYRLLTAFREVFLHDRVGDLSPVGICWAPHTFMTSEMRPTETFQGCNMSFRAEVFDEHRFEEWYGSAGSTACEEMEFSARVSASGYDTVYDPRMVMLHKRTEADESRFGDPNYDNITNLAYFVCDHERYGRWNVLLLGLAMIVYAILARDAGYFKGYLKGTRTAIGDNRGGGERERSVPDRFDPADEVPIGEEGEGDGRRDEDGEAGRRDEDDEAGRRDEDEPGEATDAIGADARDADARDADADDLGTGRTDGGGDELVSVVVPTYHRNDRLRAAIESVQAQTHEPVETIVVDGSADGEAEPVAEEYGVRYIHQGEDGGAHAARSMGAEAADGAYVNFLDDDDRFFPEKLERQLAVMRDDPDVGVVYCGVEWENGHQVLPNPEVRGDVLEHALMFEMTPSSPTAMLVDGDVLGDILPLENRHGADDMGMKVELAQRCAFDFVDEALVEKGYEEDSLGGSRENIQGRFELLERYADLYDQHPDRVRRVALAHTYLLDAERELQVNTWSLHAIKRSIQAWYTIPGSPLSFTGYMFASVFGLPGRNYARKVYKKYVLGDSHRGKLT